MKIYSDKLTDADMRTALPAGTQFEHIDRRATRGRLASQVWDVTLEHPGRPRSLNSGTSGAYKPGAASWDEHGEFFAELYDRDPAMQVRAARAYHDREDFHTQTASAYDRSMRTRSRASR